MSVRDNTRGLLFPGDLADVQIILECIVDIYEKDHTETGIYGERTAHDVMDLLEKMAHYFKKR